MMKLLLIYCLILSSCMASKKISADDTIIISKMPCGSYEVNRQDVTLGYIVKPMYLEFEHEDKAIESFENLLIEEHSNFYNGSFRVYHFTANRSGDTVLIITMLTPKQAELTPNWKCEYQDVDTYKNKYRHKSTNKHPDTFYFNFSK